MKYLGRLTARKKQILILFIVSVLGAAAGIIHGIFFDLDLSQIKRLSFFGVVFTTIIIFPAILLFEYLFDINNQQDTKELKARLSRVESQLNKCCKEQ